MGLNYKMVAKTLFGFEEILANELQDLGALKIVKGVRNVSYEGDDGMMFKANLACRTAIKILKPIHQFNVTNEQMLYDGIYKMNWDDLLSTEKTFAIDATVFSNYFNHSKYIALKTKDAIADFFRDKYKIRPNVDTQNPDLRINIHIHDNECTVSLDSSGQSLHQRGYKIKTGIAPINEVLAAGLLLQSGWRGQCDFLDPMCGSGTILIEAALIACNIPANIFRKEFAFQKWKNFDKQLFEKIKELLMNKVREFDFSIKGYDFDKRMISITEENVISSGMDEYIRLKNVNFFDSEKVNETPLHLFFNPPYDERIEIDTELFYNNIGDTLKTNYQNTNAWMVTANLPALKCVGLKPRRKIICYNGALEARLVHYDIYSGSRKEKGNE
ncbi:MAG: RNA methyltransferase [Chitinophagaceae bacterium]|nr:RNA methyltransferase [Chitinophagaceae bacterium]